ncbi:MAG: ActS/PrrB/RegB family redox-sensitive histidine kinase [Alphaproteobacteria bacterium]
MNKPEPQHAQSAGPQPGERVTWPATALPAGDVPAPVSLRTLVLIRWLGVLGQVSAVCFVHFGLGYPLPLVAALTVIAASAALNLAVQIIRPAQARISDRDAAFMLGYDIVQLTALLYLTGGLGNPFAFLIVAPVAISASILSRWITAVLILLSLGCASFIAFYYEPLPMPESAGFALPPIYLIGAWTALCMSSIFIALYVGRVAEESRRISDALADTQVALAREQRRSAVGALAAAAAHELGSPLATITVVAKELQSDLPDDGPLRDDIMLLLSQTNRCREILTRLSNQTDDGGLGPDTTFSVLPASALLESICDSHRDAAVAVLVVSEGGDGDEPMMPNSPEIRRGLGTLIENAVQFAAHQVTLTLGWTAHALTLEIHDDGPGFAASILTRLGEPYMSSRKSVSRGGGRVRTGHMGLGVFIAETLLGRSGAQVSYTNAPRDVGGGAVVTIRWPLAALAAPAGGSSDIPAASAA